LTALPLEAERSLLQFSLLPSILRLARKQVAAMVTSSHHNEIPVGRFSPRVTIDRLDKLLRAHFPRLKHLEQGVRHGCSGLELIGRYQQSPIL
jgi:hypothetical protein